MRSQSPTQLGLILESRLGAYATAAACALAGFTSPANAGVIYTKVQARCSFAGIDLNHDGTPDFALKNLGGGGGSYRSAKLFVSAVSPNGFAASISQQPAALNAGDVIGPGLAFARGIGLMASASSYYYISEGWGQRLLTGSFADEKNKFLALRIASEGQNHYGWARIDNSVNSEFGSFACGLVDYAYETVPNAPILAGQGINPASEPMAVGWLAYGADGLATVRSK